MRVKIGKYYDYYGGYQLADLLQYIGFSEDRCYKIGEYLSNTWLQKFCEWIDSKKKRKVKIHIDNFDIWSADSTLALIILPVLKAIKEEKAGCPWVDDSDVPEELRSINAPPKENEWDWDDLVFDRWNWVLDEMIFAMECASNDDWEAQFYSGKHDIYFEQCEDNPNLSEMKTGPNDTFKIDRDGYDKMNDRINNGLRLFGKYFRSLWT